MSDFQLDVDSPYPLPEKEKLSGKPNKVDYPQTRIKVGHYGKIVEQLIAKACEMDKGEERTALEKHCASLMKRFHLTFNSNSVEDEAILAHLSKLSDGKIQLSDVSFLPNTNEILRSTAVASKPKHNKNRNNNKNKNRNKNRKRY